MLHRTLGTLFGLHLCLVTGRLWSSSSVPRLSRDDPVSVQLPIKRTREGWNAVEVTLAGSIAHLLVDTGSSQLWARTSNVPKGAAAVKVLGNFSAQYGRGSVSGQVVEEPVLLSREGGVAKPRVCRLGRPREQSDFWARQRTIDGILGLGCSEEGTIADALACVVPTPPLRPALLRPRAHRVFVLQLTPEGGSLTLGSVPREVQLNLVPMPPAEDCGHWTVPLTKLSVHRGEEASADDTLVGDGVALLDSGSDGIIGPTFAVIKLARLLGASPAKAGEGYGGEVSFYEVACDAAADMPTVNLVLGEKTGATNVSITLRGSDLVAAGEDGAETCHLRVAGWDTQSWILGSVFFTRLQAVAFDVDTGVVGIAPLTSE